ncbi:MAG: ferrochelatase [Burkholderiales bacterium]|nr:ferrochelatase [Burkholderiales bacterium]
MRTEANFDHGTALTTAVVLVNLGTPDAPTAPALRRYLKQFLSDPRVVEIPRLIWWLILNLIILRIRPAKSAAKYKTVWTSEGSPLLVIAKRQAAGLREWLQKERLNLRVELAMRYGNPSIASVMDKLRADGVDRVLVLPLFPQYAAATTASIYDAVGDWLRPVRNVPELRFVKHYHDHTAYIEALAQKIECHKTGRLVAQRLGLEKDHYKVTFQSRFGKAEWLQPYTDKTLQAMGAAKTPRVDVICPGFLADCLETLEEIGDEVREEFLHAGGGVFNYITCLNDEPELIDLLGQVVKNHTLGWPVALPGIETLAAQKAELETSRANALSLGSPR